MRLPRLRRPPTSFLVGAIGAGIVIGLAGILFVLSGLFNVGASKQHTIITYWIVNTTMVHSVRHHAQSVVPPPQYSRSNALAGFCEYERHCVMCHGALGVGRDHWINGMTPTPPYLSDVPEKWTRPQTFWIIKNGVKMTAMPAWDISLSDPQIWNIVAFLHSNANKEPQIYLRLRKANLCSAT